MLGKLSAAGYTPVDVPDGADVILINTCAIRDHAEQRVIGRLGELKRHMKKDSVMGVTGCMAQRLGPLLLEKAKHVSLVVGPDGYRALPQLVDGARHGRRSITPRRFDKVKAWIPVQRGCDYRCTYCIVPTTRGAERSRKLEDVVRETMGVVAEGMSEVVLLGQTVNSYTDGTHDFADLLRAVGSVAGIRRVRFTSPHPNDFTDRAIRAMAEVPTVCEHVHLPMQSGSSRMLKRMLRRYTREGYLDCVDRIRRAIPGVSLTTDIIVGFPGETEEEFEDTLSVVREVGFADAYTFIFSPRDGTPATRLPPELSVPADVASERLQRLVETVRSASRQRNVGELGTRHEVLVEREAKRGESMLLTRTRDFKSVLIPGDASMLGQYYTVELTGTTGSTFTGSIVRERQPLPMAG
jgi:tRNA-2-methylthio-N6-dimethylallyladenosine synthase